MHFPSDWADFIKVENGHVVRYVEAQYFGQRDIPSDIVCYKEDDEGNAWCRNLYQSMWGGYTVAFPGQPFNKNSSWYYDDSIAEVEEWRECNRKHLGYSNELYPASCTDAIIELYPDFKYMFKKYQFSNLRDVMDKLIIWRKHPEIELMLAAGFEKLAMNKSLYRMKPENRKAIARFCRDNQDAHMLTLNEIRECMKHPGEEGLWVGFFNLFPSYERKNWQKATNDYFGLFDIDDYKYLVRKGKVGSEGRYLLYDYRRMLTNSAHNENDPYWKYPKDLQKAHDKLLNEENRRRAAEARLAEKSKEKQEKVKLQNLQKIVKKYSKYNYEAEGYSIYITNNLEDWQKQADELHQCILWADYPLKISQKKCLLFFIRKEDKPVATVEILPGKKIGQFYANETDRNNCKPDEVVTALVNNWVENKLVMKEVI